MEASFRQFSLCWPWASGQHTHFDSEARVHLHQGGRKVCSNIARAEINQINYVDAFAK